MSVVRTRRISTGMASIHCVSRDDPSHSLNVTFTDPDGKVDPEVTHRYPYIWLRDNCQCVQCFHPTARARLIVLKSLDLHDRPQHIKVSDDGQELVMTWMSGHETRHGSSWLLDRRLTEQPKPGREQFLELPCNHWGQELQGHIQQFTFDELLADDEVLYKWLSTMEETGLALVVSAPSQHDAVNQIGSRVSHLWSSNYGETFMVENKADPNNLAYTAVSLGLHTDLPFYHYVPGVQLLHCVSQDTEGGENDLVDGFHVAQQLLERDPEAYRILTSTHIDYVDQGVDHNSFHHFNRAPVIQLSAGGDVVRINYNNQVRDSHMAISPERVQAFYEALKTFDDLLYDKENCIQYKLCPGDVVCFHNYRVLHGRQGYRVLPGGSRLLIGGYINWDEMRSKRRVLETTKRGD